MRNTTSFNKKINQTQFVKINVNICRILVIINVLCDLYKDIVKRNIKINQLKR